MSITKLKLLRVTRSIKQVDVEEATSIPNYRLSFLENARRSPTDKELKTLAKFYDVDVETISGNVEGEFVLDSVGSAVDGEAVEGGAGA